jgi:hypothetical protein
VIGPRQAGSQNRSTKDSEALGVRRTADGLGQGHLDISSAQSDSGGQLTASGLEADSVGQVLVRPIICLAIAKVKVIIVVLVILSFSVHFLAFVVTDEILFGSTGIPSGFFVILFWRVDLFCRVLVAIVDAISWLSSSPTRFFLAVPEYFPDSS